jgi:hypothetical protein
MNRNLVGSIYGRSSVKIAHFVPIRQQTWPPQATLVSDWLIFSSPCQRQGELLPSLSVRCPLTFHILILFSETPQPNELKLVGSIYGRSFIKIAYFVLIH